MVVMTFDRSKLPVFAAAAVGEAVLPPRWERRAATATASTPKRKSHAIARDQTPAVVLAIGHLIEYIRGCENGEMSLAKMKRFYKRCVAPSTSQHSCITPPPA